MLSIYVTVLNDRALSFLIIVLWLHCYCVCLETACKHGIDFVRVNFPGTGLDFSKASVVVFVELPQEVALVRQAEDRAHRYGQQNPVNVYFLISRGTTDERR
jgi:hypothetical protein